MSNNNSKRNYILIPIIVALSVVIGFILGNSLLTKNSKNIENPTITNNSISGDKYSAIFSLIHGNYVDEISIDSIAESMIPSLLKKLDPHSSYIPPQDVSLSTANLEGQFYGIGVVFNTITDTITVQSVIPNGPSSKVGIEGGDRIITIDDSVVAGRRYSNDFIMKKLRGNKGTKVSLGIERKGIDSIQNIVVTRDKIVVNSIDAAYMVTPTIGYIKLLRFARSSHSEMISSIERLKAEGMEHLILDLTYNSGGYLDQAIHIANEFIPKDMMIVYTKRRGEVLQSQKANGNGLFIGDDITLLIDEHSASSSEILAGALQDNDIGTLIGRRSFGKGLVQQQIPLYDGSLFNLTIARYHTPTGRSIQRPYGENPEDYEMDYYNRAIHGELTNIDSVRIDTTYKYTTPKGKIVYGGGGIMPDIFVPVDTTKYSDSERILLTSLILTRYTNNYIDVNRDELLNLKSFTQLDSYLDKNSDKIYNNYVDYVNGKGGKIGKRDAQASRAIVENVIRAYIGRFTEQGDNAFYRYLLKEDDIILKAIDNINQKNKRL